MKVEFKEIALGITGVAGPAGGIAVSMSNVEAWLRIASLAVGLLVGALSIVSIVLTILYKWKHRNDPPDNKL